MDSTNDSCRSVKEDFLKWKRSRAIAAINIRQLHSNLDNCSYFYLSKEIKTYKKVKLPTRYYEISYTLNKTLLVWQENFSILPFICLAFNKATDNKILFSSSKAGAKERNNEISYLSV